MNKKAYYKGIQHRGRWQSSAESWAVLAKKPAVATKPIEGGTDSRVRSFDSHLVGIIICHCSAADGRRALRSVPIKGGYIGGLSTEAVSSRPLSSLQE